MGDVDEAGNGTIACNEATHDGYPTTYFPCMITWSSCPIVDDVKLCMYVCSVVHLCVVGCIAMQLLFQNLIHCW